MMGALQRAQRRERPGRQLTSAASRAGHGTTKVGEKLFSDSVTIKSDIGNPILRQTPIGTDGMAARPVTWVEKGVLKNLFYDRSLGEAPEEGRRRRRAPNMSLVMEGTDTSRWSR